MNIINRFVVESRNYYTVDDDGVTYHVSEKGLYAGDMLDSMKAAGFIVYDYHGDIVRPDGTPIQMLPEEPITLSEDELQQLIDCEDYVLTEAEASSYFTRNVNLTAVEFKAPVNVTIHTREEFIKYLNMCARRSDDSMFEDDVYPLNSFVAPDALFELSEVFESEEYRYYMRVIERRRVIKSYKAYKKLIKFLQEYADLGENFTADDVKMAYMSWGVCGIKTRVTNMHTKYNVTTHIADDGDPKADVMRREYVCLQDVTGTLITADRTEAYNEYEGDKAAAEMLPKISKEYMSNHASRFDWDTEYKPITCLVKEYRTRTYVDYVDEEGRYFDVRVDVENILIATRTSGVMPLLSAYLLIAFIDGSYESIKYCIDENEYFRRNILLAKASSMIEVRTVKPPVKSSLDLIMQEGVSPEAALRYIGEQFQTDPLGLNGKIDKSISFRKIHEIYAEGPSPEALRWYNPDDLEYSDIEQLTEIFLAERERQQEQGIYLKLVDTPRTYEECMNQKMAIERPIENLEFVKNVREGITNIDFYAEGIRRDNCGVSVRVLTNFLWTLLRVYNPGDVTDADFEYFVNNVEHLVSTESGKLLVDFNIIVKERVMAYRGYLKDRGLLNSRRIDNAMKFVYVTEIFREMANVPVEEQRHYAFRCVEIVPPDNDTTNKFVHNRVNVLAERISEAVKSLSTLSMIELDILQYSYKELAINLLFSIALGKTKFTNYNGEYKCTIPVKVGNIEFEVEIMVPENIANYKYTLSYRYSTLSDYCQFEMSSAPLFDMYCVNAKITPWYVSPRYVKSLPTYNYVANYVNKEVYANVSPEVRQQLSEFKVDEINKHCLGSNMLVKILPEDKLARDAAEVGLTNPADIYESRLSTSSYEDMKDYYERFLYYKKNAPAGKMLARIPLRADKVLGVYADWCGVTPVNNVVYVDDPGDNTSKLYAQTRDVKLVMKDINLQQKLLMATSNNYEQLDLVKAGASNLLRWRVLVEGGTQSKDICYIRNKKLCIQSLKGTVELDIDTELTLTVAKELCEKGVLFQLSAREFAVKTLAGLVKITIA